MAEQSKEMHDFKKQVEALKKFHGRGTELISVYITPDYAVPEIVAKLRDEYGQAANIKSSSTRKNVQSALERIMHFLKGVQKPPETGIAVFSGNVSPVEGKSDFQIYSVVPPIPIPVQFYRCESKFVLEPLEELLDRGETYGLVVLDGKEATVALLKGKSISIVKKLESTAHQKVHKGGQCVHEDSVIVTSTGVKNAKNVEEGDLILSFNFKDYKSVFSKCENVMKRTASDEFVVETNFPKKYLKLTGEHVVFVLTELGVMEKAVSDLNAGDVLLVSWNAPQLLNDCITAYNLELTGQIQGYFLGDGTIDGTRLIFYDGDKQVIEHYSKLASSLFNCNHSIKHRIHGFSVESPNPKGCFESKIYSKKAVDSLIEETPEISRKTIPKIASIDYVKGFLRGLFDAEASVSLKSGRISLAMIDEDVVLKTSSFLALFGVSTSVFRKKAIFKQQYGLEVCDLDSLTNFALKIGFNSENKSRNLAAIIAARKMSGRNKRVPIHGKTVKEIAKSLGMPFYKYLPKSVMFLNGKRFMSNNHFKTHLIPIFQARCEELIGTEKYFEALRALNYLKKIGDSDSCISIVKSVTKQEASSEFYYDFDVPDTRCFVANGLIVHNSAARFDRLHVEGVEYYYKRVAEAMDAFVGKKNFGGVIVGGPGPAKQDFVKSNYWNYQLKVLGVVDTGYTDEYGIREVIEKSSELIAEQELIKEKQLLDWFMKEVSIGSKLVVYGYNDVKETLVSKRADKLLISEDLPLHKIVYSCASCSKTIEKLEDEEKDFACECGGKYTASSKEFIFDELVALAEENSVGVIVISRDSAEGSQFYGTFKGLGAFLRY
ncbi:MAG: LAGLIDADG family homing endonuclease [Candidatus Micrarchaeota archaeon]